MEVLIGARNAFIKWMKLDLPRTPSIDGKRIGTQLITSTATSVAGNVMRYLSIPERPKQR